MNSVDPTDLQAQRQRRNKAAAASRLADDTAKEDWKWLMKTKRGRRIVWRLLEEAGVSGSKADAALEEAGALCGGTGNVK